MSLAGVPKIMIIIQGHCKEGKTSPWNLNNRPPHLEIGGKKLVMWSMFVIKNTPKYSGQQTDSSEYHLFSLYMICLLLLCSLRNNSTVRMVGKKTCSNFIDFFDLLFSSKICKKMEMTMNAAGCSLKSPSLPPVRANPRRASVFFSSSVFTVRKGVRIGISRRTLR